MKDIISHLLSSKKKRFLFGEKPILCKKGEISNNDIETIESKYSISIPKDIQEWMLSIGHAVINECFYCHDADSIYPFNEENGKITGFITFASDDGGNYYAFNPKEHNSNIYYCCHDPLGYTLLAENMNNFAIQFKKTNYDIHTLVDQLELDYL